MKFKFLVILPVILTIIISPFSVSAARNDYSWQGLTGNEYIPYIGIGSAYYRGDIKTYDYSETATEELTEIINNSYSVSKYGIPTMMGIDGDYIYDWEHFSGVGAIGLGPPDPDIDPLDLVENRLLWSTDNDFSYGYYTGLPYEMTKHFGSDYVSRRSDERTFGEKVEHLINARLDVAYAPYEHKEAVRNPHLFPGVPLDYNTLESRTVVLYGVVENDVGIPVFKVDGVNSLRVPAQSGVYVYSDAAVMATAANATSMLSFPAGYVLETADSVIPLYDTGKTTNASGRVGVSATSAVETYIQQGQLVYFHNNRATSVTINFGRSSSAYVVELGKPISEINATVPVIGVRIDNRAETVYNDVSYILPLPAMQCVIASYISTGRNTTSTIQPQMFRFGSLFNGVFEFTSAQNWGGGTYLSYSYESILSLREMLYPQFFDLLLGDKSSEKAQEFIDETVEKINEGFNNATNAIQNADYSAFSVESVAGIAALWSLIPSQLLLICAAAVLLKYTINKIND